MHETERRRGRPPGSGMDDHASMMMIAGFLVDDPKLKPTTAMKRFLRTRDRWPSSDSALIRRWQVKWKTGSTTYLQRVHDERAEAERQRQKRAVPVAQKTGMQIMAEMARAGQIPGLSVSNATRDFFAQHSGAVQRANDWRELLDGNALSRAANSAAQLFAEGHLARMSSIDAATRSAMGILGDPTFQETIRRTGSLGFTEGTFGTLSRMPKFPWDV